MSYRPYIRTPALAAAERLRESNPVRTHEWQAPPADDPREAFAGGKTGRPNEAQIELRRQRIRALLAEGTSTRIIAATVHVSRVTIQNHRRAMKKEGLLK